MSYRRSLSFSKEEKYLVDYFDNNGQSKIAKEAMDFYMNNKDKVINEGVIDIIKALNIGSNPNQQQKNLNDINSKFNKFKK